jgi:uncharacterized protein (DUF58 family)
LLSYPDPRRIDIRLTIRDPMEQVYVRLFNQKSAIPVIALCDISGSMQFGSYQRKISVAADIVQSIAKSATQNADPFALVSFDDEVREEWLCPASFRSHHALEMAERLRDYHPEAKGSKGLFDVPRHLPRERSLIFLISDFHMPMTDLEDTLALMLRHHIVPIVLWDEAEYKRLPDFGITSVIDPESGTRRTLFMRKSYRDRIIANFEERREAIRSLFLRLDMPPLFIEHGFDADMLTDYFHLYVAA